MQRIRDGVARVQAALKGIAKGAGLVGGAIILVLAGFIVVDVIGRRFFSVSTSATDEVAGLAAAVVAATAFLYTYAVDEHVTIDVVVARFSARVQHRLAMLADLMMAGFAGVVAWVAFGLMSTSIRTGNVTLSMGFPLWIPQLVIVAMAGLLALTALVRVVARALGDTSEDHDAGDHALRQEVAGL